MVKIEVMVMKSRSGLSSRSRSMPTEFQPTNLYMNGNYYITQQIPIHYFKTKFNPDDKSL